MGIIDRDYMNDPKSGRDARAHRPPESPLLPWAIGLSIAALVIVGAFAPMQWFPDGLAKYVERARHGTSLAAARSSHELGRLTVEPLSAMNGPGSSTRTVRCVMNGTSVEIVGSRCPPAVATEQPVQPPRLIDAPPTESPFRKPGTIYRCKNYSGGMFWSNSHCSQHNSLIDRMASVPVGLPFQQQVDIASREANQIEQAIEREQREGARSTLCSALQNERAQIWTRSGSGAGYVRLDQLGQDQTRWRQIESLLNANGCPR